MKNKNLLFGIAWLIFGILALVTKDKVYWTDYGYIVISFLYFGNYFYSKNKNGIN